MDLKWGLPLKEKGDFEGGGLYGFRGVFARGKGEAQNDLKIEMWGGWRHLEISDTYG